MISQEHKKATKESEERSEKQTGQVIGHREAEQRRCTEGYSSTYSTLLNFHKTNTEQLLHMIVLKRSRTSG